MTEPVGRGVDRTIKSDFVERITMSFSLCAMVAEHSKKQNSQPQNWLRPGADASAIHGRLGARVALLQSPIPPTVPTSIRNQSGRTNPKGRAPLTASFKTTTNRKVALYP